jgi:hypothetical protein
MLNEYIKAYNLWRDAERVVKWSKNFSDVEKRYALRDLEISRKNRDLYAKKLNKVLASDDFSNRLEKLKRCLIESNHSYAKLSIKKINEFCSTVDIKSKADSLLDLVDAVKRVEFSEFKLYQTFETIVKNFLSILFPPNYILNKVETGAFLFWKTQRFDLKARCEKGLNIVFEKLPC